MKKKLRLVLIIVGVVLAVVIAEAILFVTAKPKVTVDYVAEYNAITLPENYNPSDNATPYYQKAFDVFVEMPQEIMISRINWPADYNDSEQALFQKWLASNSQAFEQFKIAANKPYYWLERKADRYNAVSGITTPEWPPLRQLIEAVAWQAKQNACNGQPQAAFEKILDCYKAGCQKCRTPSFATEQYWGLVIKRMATNTALAILDKTSTDSTTLKSFQDAFSEELTKDKSLPDLEVEKIYLYDLLQRTYVYNGRETGRLAWNIAKDFIGACGQWNIIEVLESCLIGPTQNQMIEQINQWFASFDSIKMKTPKQLRSYDRDYFVKIDTACENNFILGLAMPSLHGIHTYYHQAKSHSEVVVTILAILRYKADTGQFPDSLDKLVSAGYLQSVPMDPYSDGPLVYKVAEDNFKLYSIGEDFVDNGGVKTLDVSDIIYWPVQRPERPKPSSDAEKETESPQETADANQPK